MFTIELIQIVPFVNYIKIDLFKKQKTSLLLRDHHTIYDFPICAFALMLSPFLSKFHCNKKPFWALLALGRQFDSIVWIVSLNQSSNTLLIFICKFRPNQPNQQEFLCQILDIFSKPTKTHRHCLPGYFHHLVVIITACTCRGVLPFA